MLFLIEQKIWYNIQLMQYATFLKKTCKHVKMNCNYANSIKEQLLYAKFN